MFYQKERKIQIFLKTENLPAAQKRHASESNDSERINISPKKVKTNKLKKDQHT